VDAPALAPVPQVARALVVEPPVETPAAVERAPEAPAAPVVEAPVTREPTLVAAAPVADDILAVHLDGPLMLPPVVFSAPERAGAEWLIVQAEAGGVRPSAAVLPGPIVIDMIDTPPLQMAALTQGEGS
jgi:hypothetical protein